MLKNRGLCLVNICIVLVFCGCNSQLSKAGKSDCVSILKSKVEAFDTSKEVDEYLKEVTSYVYKLDKKALKKRYNNCSKSEIIKYYLSGHPMIDSVQITPSGHGISFFRKDDNVWANMLIE